MRKRLSAKAVRGLLHALKLSLVTILLTSCAEVPLTLATINSALELTDRFIGDDITATECEWVKPILFDDASMSGVELLTDKDLKRLRVHNELYALYCVPDTAD